MQEIVTRQLGGGDPTAPSGLRGTAVSGLALLALLVFAAADVIGAGTPGRIAAAQLAGLAAMWALAIGTSWAFPPDRGSRPRVLAATITAILVAVGLRAALLAATAPEPGSAVAAFLEVVHATAAETLLLMGLLLAGGRALSVFPRVRRTALDHASREIQVRRGRLASLTGQIRPHFAGNALNCVAGLSLTDVAAARCTLRRLRSVVSRSSQFSDVQEIRLHEELSLIRDYVAIEQARFQDRLKVHFDIQPETLDAYIPSLVLQPLVENAIVHGVMRKTGHGDIQVRAELQEDELHLVVEDCGPGLPGRNLVRGVGSRVTQDRLSSVHPGAARLTLSERLEGGTRARVFLPFTTTPSLRRAEDGHEGTDLQEAVQAAVDVRKLDLMPGAVVFWMLVAASYAWQLSTLAPDLALAVATGLGMLAAAGAGGLALLAYHLGRTTPLERGQRVQGLLAMALLVAPAFVLYWRTLLLQLWSSIPGSTVTLPEGTRLVALAFGLTHVVFAGYVVHQQSVVAAHAALIRTQHEDLADAERRQRGLALSDTELASSFEAIDAALDRDPEEARRYMADLMARLRRAAENRS